MIDVLLATYRPAADILQAQVDSIRAQEGVETRLSVREDELGEGAARNFSELLSRSTGDYVALSDQDDVWRKNKLARLMDEMRRLEGEAGTDTPLLVFCDSTLTDMDLNPLPGSFLARQRVDVARGIALPRLLVQNFIAGHAMLFNAALREKAGFIPHEAVMHDAWLALVAAAFGRIGFVDEELVLYRQHDGNALGAARLSSGAAEFRRRLNACVAQADAFARRFGDDAPPCVHALAGLRSKGWLVRRTTLLRYNLLKHGFLRNLALMAFV